MIVEAFSYTSAVRPSVEAHSQCRRPSGASPRAGRTIHPGRNTNDLAGIPQRCIMAGPNTVGR